MDGRKNWIGDVLFVHRYQKLFLSVYVGWHKHGWKETEPQSCVEETDNCPSLVSLCCYLFSSLSYLYSDLHSFFHVNSAKGNPLRLRPMRSIAPWRYTILPHLTVADSTPSPASTRTTSTRSRALEDELHGKPKTNWGHRSNTWNLVAWSARMVGGLHRKSSGRRSVRITRESDQELSKKRVSGKHSFFPLLPDWPKLRSTQENQNY